MTQAAHPLVPMLPWKKRRVAAALDQLVRWSKYSYLPVPYSCNDVDVWVTTSKGWNAPGEREYRRGQNELLDQITKHARHSRPVGGRFEVMADGAYWAESGLQFIAWKYVDLDDY
jgi:hypothetical protein